MIMNINEFDDLDDLDDLDDFDDDLDSTSESPAVDLHEITEAFFAPDSPLAEAVKHGGRPYEHRPQQGQMAIAVAEALIHNTNLCVEAPTGIGKSFAYLVPVIYHALANPKPVLITTETINLQEQLVDKDLPLLKELLGLDFSYTLAKGRSNYVCLRRLRLMAGDTNQDYLPSSAMIPTIHNVARWAETTTDGSRASLDIKVENQLWSCICCEVGNCSGPRCKFFGGCFYWTARKKWDKSDIIIANHALFFTDLKIKQEDSQESFLLPNYCAVIFDEAHTLEDSAASHLGMRLSWAGLYYTLNRLFDPATGKGLLMKPGKEAIELRQMIADVLESASRFFGLVRERLLESDDTCLRIRRPGFVPDLVTEQLHHLDVKLMEFMKLQEDDDYRSELDSQVNKCESYAKGLFDFINMNLDEHVYWTELTGNADTGNIYLTTAPVNINHVLRDSFFNREFPVILTSATLSVCNRLNYYRNRTGYTGGPELCLDSPFDFQRQVKLYLTKSIPMPDESNFQEELPNVIKHFIQLTHGKAFVLFTSYSMLKMCAEKLSTFFSVNDITLLVQGEDKTRSMMLREFREDTNSVIFGTTSFWTGVDVPGEALSNVIITKLPFSVPTHPLVEARIEKIKETGESPFMAYNLPEAILKLRQGVGRLIRSKTDTGIIAILDKRVIVKKYGNYFLESLPQCPVEMV